MKMFYQIVSALTGERTAAFSGDRGFVARLMRDEVEKHPSLGDCLVLVLVDDATDKEWEFSKAPLMKVSTFVSEYAADGVLVADKE